MHSHVPAESDSTLESDSRVGFWLVSIRTFEDLMVLEKNAGHLRITDCEQNPGPKTGCHRLIRHQETLKQYWQKVMPTFASPTSETPAQVYWSVAGPDMQARIEAWQIYSIGRSLHATEGRFNADSTWLPPLRVQGKSCMEGPMRPMPGVKMPWEVAKWRSGSDKAI